MDIEYTVKHNIGNTITISNSLNDIATTYFTADTVASSTTLNVTNTDAFDSTGVILLGTLTQETAEFLTYSGKTSTTLTSGATVFPHNRGENVTYTLYNQIVVEKATSATGSFTVLGTFSIQPTSTTTIIQDAAGLSTTFYRIKYRNSLLGTSSDYSEIVSPSTNDLRSVAIMFDRVKRTVGIAEDDTVVNTQFLIDALNDGRQYVDNQAHGVHWDWREEFEKPLQLLSGTNFVLLPDDIDFSTTNRSVLCLRYPRYNYLSPIPLTYVDKKGWNVMSYQSRGSVTSTSTSIGATTITVDNVGDFFPTGGSGFVATDNFTQDIMQITYTGINLTTNQITGVTGVTRVIPTGTQIFAVATIGMPQFFTVYEDRIVFEKVIQDGLNGTNLYIDYYKRLMPVVDINEILPERYRNIYEAWLKYKIKCRKDPTTSKSDGDFVEFTTQLASVLQGIYSGQTLQIVT